MTRYSDVPASLAHYHAEWRHQQLEPLQISGLYDLFPRESTTVQPAFRWNPGEKWPHADRPGVYFVFGAGSELLYIGQSRLLGKRLSEWFGGGIECSIRGTWRSRQPRFVATTPVGQHFEAVALEAYLIETLDPPDNTALRNS